MLRVEQGFSNSKHSVYPEEQDPKDGLDLFIDHIYHGYGRRVPEETLLRITRPTPDKVGSSRDWVDLRPLVMKDLSLSEWNIERTEHPEWPEVSIWLARRTLTEQMYERLTVLSYPAVSDEAVKALMDGEPVTEDLVLATAVVGMLDKYQSAA